MSPGQEPEDTGSNAFVGMQATSVLRISPDDPIHPPDEPARIAAAVGKSKALVGLRQAANDAVEPLRDLTQGQATAFDARLRAAGIMPLDEMRRRYSKQCRATLERGKARNESELHLVKGVLDSRAESLGGATRRMLVAMPVAFERGG